MKQWVTVLVIFYTGLLSGQNNLFFKIDTLKPKGWPAIHSFSYGSWDEKVYLIGGRKDGIHEKKSGFGRKENNRFLYIWDPVFNTLDSLDLGFIPDTLGDPLSAAGTSFVQKGQYLIIAGGYGENAALEFVTYPSLTVLDLSLLSDPGAWTEPGQALVRQIIHPRFAVAGGQLGVIDEIFYLAGGNKFEGRYDDNSGLVNQEYTDRVSLFELKITGDSVWVNPLREIKDEFNFHRRDFNMVPFVFEDGKAELMLFSGVFLINENRPFFNIARLNESGYSDISGFNHLLANYHCAKLGLYEKGANVMHQYFFGGMAEYAPDGTGLLVRDPLVPFVKTISSVVRKADGSYEERFQDTGLPGFFGTNSEFILMPHVPVLENQKTIVDLDKITTDSIFLGYIFGGIFNPGSEPNPWVKNRASSTLANPYLLKVSLVKGLVNSQRDFREGKAKSARLNIYEQAVQGQLRFRLDADNWKELSVWLIGPSGGLAHYQKFLKGDPMVLDLTEFPDGSYIIYSLLDGTHTGTEKFIKLSK